MNKILKPATPDRLLDGSPACGFDEFGQLNVRWNLKDDPDYCHSTFVHDVRAEQCPLCGRGWENTVASLRDQQFLHSMGRHVHGRCLNGFNHLNNFNFWCNLVHGVKRPPDIPSLTIEETPNLYGSDWTGPWYRVTFSWLPAFQFVVGSRKRVYHMELKPVTNELVAKLEAAFAAEDVTKHHDCQTHKEREGVDSWIIHAWTKEKAKQYLDIMLSLLSP